MTDYKRLLKELRQHKCPASEEDTQDVCETCSYDVIVEDSTARHGIRDVCVCGTMERAADAITELLKAASAMHTWIFLNTADEQAAYDECGLSPEMNAALGSVGRVEVEGKDNG